MLCRQPIPHEQPKIALVVTGGLRMVYQWYQVLPYDVRSHWTQLMGAPYGVFGDIQRPVWMGQEALWDAFIDTYPVGNEMGFSPLWCNYRRAVGSWWYRGHIASADSSDLINGWTTGHSVIVDTYRFSTMLNTYRRYPGNCEGWYWTPQCVPLVGFPPDCDWEAWQNVPHHTTWQDRWQVKPPFGQVMTGPGGAPWTFAAIVGNGLWLWGWTRLRFELPVALTPERWQALTVNELKDLLYQHGVINGTYSWVVTSSVSRTQNWDACVGGVPSHHFRWYGGATYPVRAVDGDLRAESSWTESSWGTDCTEEPCCVNYVPSGCAPFEELQEWEEHPPPWECARIESLTWGSS